MAFALAAGDIVAPGVYALFAATSEPPPQGLVTSISPTIVLWQDGSQVSYTASTVPGSVDAGLSKFVADFNSPFINKKVRPKTGGLYKDFSNVDHRAEGIVVLAGAATNVLVADDPIVIVRLDSNGLYVVLRQAELDIIPGA